MKNNTTQSYLLTFLLGLLLATVIPREVKSQTFGISDISNLTNYHMVFTDGSSKANWQGATKGFVGNVAVNGIVADEKTSGTVPFAGIINTNSSSLSAWQAIVNSNAGQASAMFNQTTELSTLQTELENAFTQINALPVTSGFSNRSSTSLNGLNKQNDTAETIVINITSGFGVSSKINITGDVDDLFILRWDTDENFSDGYEGVVKFQSGGAIVPKGNLKASNFIHVAGDINSSGGGSNPPLPYPQGPRSNNGLGSLISGGSNFSGGGFFTGYWLTTGEPTVTGSGQPSGKTGSLSNGIFVGGWYSKTNEFSMTSGTSGVYVGPNIPINLCGNVFKDEDGPANVNGEKIYNTNFDLLSTVLHANLIQGGVVKRTTPIESDGSYCFKNVDTFTTYTICLDTLPAVINSSSTTITPSLPEHWVSVSENCGLTGNDGLPADAKLTLTTGSPISGDIKDCNFGLVDTCVSISLTLDTVCRFDPIPLRDKEAELPLDLQGGTWHAYVYASSARLVLDTSYAIGVDDSTAKGQNADYVYTKGTYGIGCYAQDTFKVTSYEPNYTANIFNPDGGVLGNGITTLQFYYNAKELDGLATCGVVRLFIPRFGDRFVPKFDSTYTEQTVPIIGGGPVDNSEWFFDDTNPAYFLWTYVGDGSNDGVDSNGNMIWLDRFPAGGDKWMRFTGEYDAKGTAGQTSVSIQIFQGSGGETKITDNVTANVIVYGDGSTSQGPKPGGNHQPQDINNSDKLEINKD